MICPSTSVYNVPIQKAGKTLVSVKEKYTDSQMKQRRTPLTPSHNESTTTRHTELKCLGTSKDALSRKDRKTTLTFHLHRVRKNQCNQTMHRELTPAKKKQK